MYSLLHDDNEIGEKAKQYKDAEAVCNINEK
jgi:hypothetical protein